MATNSKNAIPSYLDLMNTCTQIKLYKGTLLTNTTQHTLTSTYDNMPNFVIGHRSDIGYIIISIRDTYTNDTPSKYGLYIGAECHMGNILCMGMIYNEDKQLMNDIIVLSHVNNTNKTIKFDYDVTKMFNTTMYAYVQVYFHPVFE